MVRQTSGRNGSDLRLDDYGSFVATSRQVWTRHCVTFMHSTLLLMTPQRLQVARRCLTQATHALLGEVLSDAHILEGWHTEEQSLQKQP